MHPSKTRAMAPGRSPLKDGTSKANSLASAMRDGTEKPIQSSLFASNKSSSVQHTTNKSHNLPIARPGTTTASSGPSNPKRNSAISTSSTNTNGPVRPRKTHVGPWQLGQTVGKGGTARVRMVRHGVTGQIAVAKIISKVMAEKVRARSLANLVSRVEKGGKSLAANYAMPLGLEREVVIMRLLKHQNIVQLYDVWENRNEIYLIMEYVEGGELFDYVSRKGPLEEREAVYLFRQIVAALLYCHRLHIIHRDLKPENILLDTRTYTIKLIDFGMAALQPRGNFLSTPCGSPHYAAPELLTTKYYDGSKVDVWSMAVVLFVMLTGDPPFNYPPDLPSAAKLKVLYTAILNADHKMPSGLSTEAQDLFRKTFVPDPKKRMSIQQLWEHPFLHKYNAEFGFQGNIDIEEWIGPKPTIDNWKPLTYDTIDPEILRNLQTLWHDSNEETLLQKLCDAEPNQEKYFYSALCKYRDEQLENMYSGTTELVCSASDYQHARRGIPPPKQSSNSHQRTTSQYSVLNNEHLYSRHSFFEPPPSEASYDPFRASREPSLQVKQNYVQVTVHRPNSLSRNRLQQSGQLPSSRRSSFRVDAMRRRGSRRSSNLSSISVSAKGSPGQRLSSASMRQKMLSRASKGSSARLNSPSTGPVMRPSSRYKRVVNFEHRHRGSATLSTPLTSSEIPHGQLGGSETRGLLSSSAISWPNLPSSPPVLPETVVRSAKENLRILATPRTRKLKDIEQEARKVSHELEKVCEEAFFRSSISDSGRTSITDKPSPYSDTPPSSMSRSSPHRAAKTIRIDRAALNRPLPPPPPTEAGPSLRETPGTYTARELLSTRQRLALRYAQDGANNQVVFNDILQQLDSLMPPASGFNGRRTATTPTGSSLLNSPEEMSHQLQAIPEEGRFADSSDERLPRLQDGNMWWNGAVTDARDGRVKASPKPPILGTIRIVEPSSPVSPSPLAPLRVRKQSMNGPKSRDSHGHVAASGVHHHLNCTQRSSPKGEDIFDSFNSSKHKQHSKKHWWHRTGPKQDREDMSAFFEWTDLDDRVVRRDERMASSSPQEMNTSTAVNTMENALSAPEQHSNDPFASTVSIEESLEHEVSTITTKKRFFGGLFGKKKIGFSYEVGVNPSAISLSYGHDSLTGANVYGGSILGANILGAGTAPVLIPGVVPLAEPWNFFARMFNIRPEVKTFALNIPRKDAREELMMIFRIYAPRGLTDITQDPNNMNAFSARLGEDNSYRLKCCSFAVEIFAILRLGQPAPLSVIRFTQTRGSTISLRRMYRHVGEYFKAQGCLVEDKEEAKAMINTLKAEASGGNNGPST